MRCDSSFTIAVAEHAEHALIAEKGRRLSGRDTKGLRGYDYLKSVLANGACQTMSSQCSL